MTGHFLLLPSGVASAVLAYSAASLFAPSFYSGAERDALGSIAWLVVPIASLILLSKWVGFQIAGLFLTLSFVFISRKRHPFISGHIKEALNFQLSIAISSLLISLLFAIALFLTWRLGTDVSDQYVVLILGITIALPIFAVFQIGAAIMAILKAAQGQVYRYPLIWRVWK